MIQKLTDYYTTDNHRYVLIDGTSNTTMDDCYATIYPQLSIPDYFGSNLDALEEIMNDLEWIEENKVTFLILHFDAFLKNDPEKKGIFMEILSQSEVENTAINIVCIN
jgi:RNAse (barnase) inhibitor barstar